jgi:hypothetical protein
MLRWHRIHCRVCGRRPGRTGLCDDHNVEFMRLMVKAIILSGQNVRHVLGAKD